MSAEPVVMKMTGQWSGPTSKEATQSLPFVPPIQVAQHTVPVLAILMSPASQWPKWLTVPAVGVFLKAFANQLAGKISVLSEK